MSLERIGSYNGAEEMALQPGTTLGPYEIVSLLGVGGMGEVYLAREVSLGRNVALKVLPSDFTHDVHRVARFEQEARSASALSHPNICTIYALGELSDGRRFIAMEHVAGETLRHRLTTSRLAVREAVDIGTQIAAALSAAHSAGIVHRDIKPENVMLRPDGFVKVLDFGLAKLTVPSDSAATASTQTAFRTDAHTVLGTIAYMSPEQARGQQVDARSDVWALGVVLYEMAAGHSPFRGETGSDVLAAILDREPESLSRFDALISQELQRIVSKMLRKNRDERYQTMKDAELDLRAFLRVTDAGQVQVSASGSIPGHEAQVPSLKRRELSVWLNSVVGLRRGVTVAAIIAVLMGAGLVCAVPE